MAGRFSVEAVFKAIDRVTAPVTRMQNSVGKFTRSMETGLEKTNKRMDKIGDGIKKIVGATVLTFGLMTGAMADVINTGAQFEQTLVTAASKFGGIKKGSETFKQLEDAARKAGASTEFTASQAAEALTELAAAGFDVTTSINALPKVIDLATAAQVDLGMATQMVSDSMGAFGLATKDPVKAVENMTRVMDVMSSTADASTLDFAQVFESFKKAGPIATAAGVNIETVASMLGIMGNAGIKAELAGTAVQNMLLNMASPTAKASSLMKKLGVSFKDSKGKFKDLPVILDSLNKAMVKMTAPQKAAALETLFGREGLGGMVSLVAAGGKEFEDFRKIVEGSMGSTQDKATQMRDTFQGSMKSLSSAIEGVKISIFSMTQGPLKDVVDRMTMWVRANGDLIATRIGEFLITIIDNLDSIVTWIERIGIALGVFIAFTAILKTFVLTMTAVNLVMAMNPLGLLVLAVTALIAGFTALVVWIDDIKAGFDKLPDAVRAILLPITLLIEAIKWIKDNIGALSNLSIGDITDKIGGALSGAANFLGIGGTETTNIPTDTTGLTPIPQVISPQERIAKNIEEKKTLAEVVITDKTGTAQVTNSTMGTNLKLNSTGGF